MTLLYQYNPYRDPDRATHNGALPYPTPPYRGLTVTNHMSPYFTSSDHGSTIHDSTMTKPNPAERDQTIFHHNISGPNTAKPDLALAQQCSTIHCFTTTPFFLTEHLTDNRLHSRPTDTLSDPTISLRDLRSGNLIPTWLNGYSTTLYQYKLDILRSRKF